MREEVFLKWSRQLLENGSIMLRYMENTESLENRNERPVMSERTTDYSLTSNPDNTRRHSYLLAMLCYDVHSTTLQFNAMLKGQVITSSGQRRLTEADTDVGETCFS